MASNRPREMDASANTNAPGGPGPSSEYLKKDNRDIADQARKILLHLFVTQANGDCYLASNGFFWTPYHRPFS